MVIKFNLPRVKDFEQSSTRFREIEEELRDLRRQVNTNVPSGNVRITNTANGTSSNMGISGGGTAGNLKFMLNDKGELVVEVL